MTETFDLVLFAGGAYAYAPARIKEEAEKLKLNYTVFEYRNLKFSFSDNRFEITYQGNQLPDARGVFLRALGEDTNYDALKICLMDRYGEKLLNFKSFAKWISLNKTAQYLKLCRAGVPVIESTVFGSKEVFLEWAKDRKFPIIVKENTGSMGFFVFKINSFKELVKLLEKYSLITIKRLIAQEFLEAGEDLRVIILNKKILGAMKRIAKGGEYLTNYSQGGDVVKYEIENDHDASEISISAAECFDLDYCGVDLMKSPSGWKVLEVNRACQFQGFEKSTGINAAYEIVKYLTK